MTQIFILLIVFQLNGSISSTTAEFHSELACETARLALFNEYRDSKMMLQSICLKK